MMDTAKEMQHEAEKLIEKISGASSDLFVMGANTERVRIFEKLRSLIQEKDSINDSDAANILGWAYERLAD